MPSPLTEALRLDPSNGIIQAYKAFLYGRLFEENTGLYVDPITVAIEASPGSGHPGAQRFGKPLGDWRISLQITDNREQAVQEYLLAIQQNPNISEIHLELGVTYRALGVIDLAIQQYTLANTYNPSDIRPYLYSSRRRWAAIGEYAKAAQYAESAVVKRAHRSLLALATGASCCTRISSGTKPWNNLPWQ